MVSITVHPIRRIAVVSAALALGLAGCSGSVQSPVGAAADSAAPPSGAPSSPGPASSGSTQPTDIQRATFQYGALLSDLQGAELEKLYLGEIIEHHRTVVMMAQLQLERGTHEELKVVSRAIIASQQGQIQEFTNWLDSWHGLTPEQARQQAPQPAQPLLDQLRAQLDQRFAAVQKAPAGPEFDKVFMQQVIPHHQTAIVESLPVQGRVPHRAISTAATASIGGQSMQVATMLNWLAAWYGSP